VWPSVAAWIESAAGDSAYFKTQDVIEAIQNRSAQLWLCWENEKPEAVCVTQIENTSKGKHCAIWIMTGHDRTDWQDLIDDLEAWARREGCVMMRHEARPGWARILKSRGYRMPHVILEKEL
jgi:hypothetical protein